MLVQCKVTAFCSRYRCVVVL